MKEECMKANSVEGVNHALFKSVVERSPTGYAFHKIVLDENNRPCDDAFIEVNAAFENFAGLQRSDVLGKRSSEVIPTVFNNDFNWVSFYEDLWLNGGEKEIEQFSVSMNKWFKIRAYSPEKEIFITCMTDITSEKELEFTIDKLNSQSQKEADRKTLELMELYEALKREQALIESIFDSIPGYLYVYDESGRLIKWNKKHETMTGYSTEELSHMTLEKWFSQEDFVKVTAAVNQVFEKGYGEVEAPLILKNGEKMMIRSSGAPFMLDGHKYFTGIGVDITEQNRVQEELLASQRIARLGTWRLDLATNQVVWSEELYKMYGFDPTVPPPPYTEHKKLFTPESWDKLSTSLEQTRTSGIPYELELETVTKDGLNGWMWVRGEAVKDSNGNITGLWGAAQDITERIQLEIALRQKNDELAASGEELEAMNEEIRVNLQDLEVANRELTTAKKMADESNLAKSQFLSNMSHEIRTPMNGFMGMIQLMETTELSEEQQELMQLAATSANSLLVLVNDILDYSRIEADKLELDRKNFALEELINEVMTLFKISADCAGLSLEAVIEKGTPAYFTGDPFRLKQIISNLVGNAIKFTKKGSVTLVVKAVNVQGGKEVKLEFEVKDTGIGIAADKVDLLFKRFSQVDNSDTRMYGGSGLGLSICKGLVEKMGGEIWVETMEGEGSRFYFTCILEKAAVEHKNHEDCLTKKVENANEINILLAEDDEASKVIIEKVAKTKGWQVTLAETGKEAVEIFRRKSFDIVLMDVEMPLMNGFVATELIREFERTKETRTPIVAITVFSLSGDKEKCLEAGMDDYLSKPVNLNEFCEVVVKWTKGR